jgi:hypothetical protein
LKDATLFFSRATPNLATVIPAMDFINDKLTAHARDRTLSPAIKASLELGKKTLNRYYSLTDSSEVYRIAMGMWPMFYSQALLIPLSTSFAPTSQACILQNSRLGTGVDRYSKGTGT